MARSVNDVAVALGVMIGIDPADAATKKSEGKFTSDYTKDLNIDALKGARIGIARDFLGADPDVDWVVEASLEVLAGTRPRGVVTFGYSDDEAFAVGLTCGGTIHIYIEPLDW